MDDAAFEQDERGPQRRCIVTREHGAPERMLRFVASPDGMIVPDLAARLPGRGIWLSARRDVIETARTRNLFSRAAKARVTVPPDLLEVLEAGMAVRIAQTLGLARRAGQAVCGFAKCRELIVARRAGLVVQAEGGSGDELARLVSGARSLPVVMVDGSALAQAFGREKSVWAVLMLGSLASRLLAEYERFSGLAVKSAPDPRPEPRTGLEQAGI